MNSPNDQHLNLVQETLNDSDLAGHLAASNDSGKWLLGVGNSAIKVVQLLQTQLSAVCMQMWMVKR